MKYHVYAALIATTSAGPVADQFEKKMPTEKEIQTFEDNVTNWADYAENIGEDLEPIMEERHETLNKAMKYA